MEPAPNMQCILKPLHARRYDELTFPMAHDCHCVGSPKEWTFKEKVMRLHSCTQTRGPRDQIRDGIRAFRINTCYWKGQVRLNHGPPIAQYVFPVQTVFGSLEEFLHMLHEYLTDAKHKKRVITIFDEGDCPVEKIIPVYEKVFGDLSNWLVQRTDDSPFPVIGELVSSGPRVLVWMRQVERERAMKQSEVARREANDVRYRCFHSLWGNNVWQSPWCMYDHKHSEYAVWPDDVVANREKGAGHRSSPLYLYNHMFYTEGINELPTHLRFIINRAAGHFETADYNKNHLCVGPLLNYDTIKAWKVTRRRPNFVNVDFYQGVMGVQSNLFSLVSAMNHTELLAPAHVPYPIVAVAALAVPHVGTVVVLTAGGGLHLTVPSAQHRAMRLTLPEGSKFSAKATLVHVEAKIIRIFAIDDDGQLCAGKVSLEAALPLASVSPVISDRMTTLHFATQVPPAAVCFNGTTLVAARRKPSSDDAPSKLQLLYEKPNGTWHKHSCSSTALAPPSPSGPSLVVAHGAAWAFAIAENGAVLTWRGTSTASGGIEWEEKARSEALYSTCSSPTAFATSERHICVVGLSASKAQVLLHKMSTHRCSWSKKSKILQMGTIPQGLHGPLVSDIHGSSIIVAALAECAHMVDVKLGLKGLALYSARVPHKRGTGEWRLVSPALVQRVYAAEAATGAVFYTMQDAAWASIAAPEDADL